MYKRQVEGQIDDLVSEVNKETANHHKVLITTLTKRMAEDLTNYMAELGIRVKYLHSDIDTLERAEIIRDLRLDVFDVLVGINLLREGLDIPEITLVAILDADKEGFLRSETSLIPVSYTHLDVYKRQWHTHTLRLCDDTCSKGCHSHITWIYRVYALSLIHI